MTTTRIDVNDAVQAALQEFAFGLTKTLLVTDEDLPEERMAHRVAQVSRARSGI